MNELNQNQQEAVISTSQYTRVIAGAGSGKTRVLTTRIAYLVENLGIFAGNILAITFTNKAANEMKERINRILPEDGGAVHISTIHSLCVRILREDIQAINYPRNFTVIDQDDQKTIVKEAYKTVGLDNQTYSYFAMLDYIAGNKGGEVSVERAIDLAGNNQLEQKKAQVYAYYQKRLHELYALDFDDLLLVTVKIFKLHQEVLAKWQYRFKYIHVDEFQDIDPIQYELIRLLAGKDNSVYVVGDPDQTIYSWRGADVNIIMNFQRDFPNAHTVILNENYRSNAPILNGANSLIKNNKNRVEKDLFTNKQEGDPILHFCATSEEHEALWIGTKIKELVNNGVSYSDIAILYRSNYMSRFIEKGLLDLQVPYIIFGGTRFYDRAEVKDAISYLRLVANGDDLAFQRVINVPRRGIGEKTIDKIRQQAFDLGVSMFDALSTMQFSGKIQKEIDAFVQLIMKVRNNQNEYNISQSLNALLDLSGYRRMLEINNETDRLENLKELVNDIEVFIAAYPAGGLDEYLQLVSLYGDKSSYDKGSYVQLMTVHAAKGLEFDYVFVVGMSDGVFPSERSMMEGRKGLEEERRLAYVAFTRAKKQLYITESSGFNYVLSRPRTPSRFIKEIDAEFIEHQGGTTSMQQMEDANNFKDYSSGMTFNTQSRPVTYKVGDMVVHTVFGEGCILSLNQGIAEIAFDFPHGVKQIMADHPAIKKK